MGRKPKMNREPYRSLRFDLPVQFDTLFREQAETSKMSLKDYFIRLIQAQLPGEVELNKLQDDLSQAKLKVAEIEFLISKKKRGE